MNGYGDMCVWCVKVKVKGEGWRVKVRVKLRVRTSRPTTQIMTIEYGNTNANLVLSQKCSAIIALACKEATT